MSRDLSRRLVILVGLIIAAAALNLSGAGDYLSIAGVKSRLGDAQAFHRANPIGAIAAFMAVQVTALALCLPGAVLALALAAGAIFGPMWGIPIVLLSLTIGDSLGFLLARYVFGGMLARRYRDQLATIEQGASASYLLALRMMAVMPYFVVNIAMAMTPMKLRVFAPVSFLGLIPSTIIYVSAGAQLARIGSASDILTPPVLASLTAIAVLPIVGHWAYRRNRRNAA